MKKSLDEMPKVELWAKLTTLDGKASSEIAAAGANGCFDQRSAKQIYDEDYAPLTSEKLMVKKEAVFRETSGRGHGSVIDQSYFTFVMEDVPRYTTLFLCGPQYLSHLQQSLRRASADRGFVLSDDEWEVREGFSLNESVKTAEKLLYKSFSFYNEMCKNGIPGEDARYILPLATRTNILTSGDARELMHLHWLSEQEEVPSVTKKVVKEMLSQAAKEEPELMKRRDNNYEALAWFPSPVLFGENHSLEELIETYENKEAVMTGFSNFKEVNFKRAVIDRDPAELANLKHIHYTFLVPMSLSCFHQATRQRTWDQSVESIYDSASNSEIIIPPSIQDSEYASKFKEIADAMVNCYYSLFNQGIKKSEAITVVPHALKVYDLIHMNGWNVIHSIGKRTCKEAQWEIREIARDIARIIREDNPELGKYAVPQGINYGKCPERKSCGLCIK